MFFNFSHFQAGWNQSIETKLRYSGAQKNIFYIPLLLVLRGGEVMAVVIPVGRYVPWRTSDQQLAHTIVDKNYKQKI